MPLLYNLHIKLSKYKYTILEKYCHLILQVQEKQKQEICCHTVPFEMTQYSAALQMFSDLYINQKGILNSLITLFATVTSPFISHFQLSLSIGGCNFLPALQNQGEPDPTTDYFKPQLSAQTFQPLMPGQNFA